MISKISISALTLAAVFLAGCKEDQPAEKVNTVEWYKENRAERDAQLAKCQSNPGETALTPNCVNANRAKQSSTWGATGSGVAPVAPLTASDINKK